MLQGGTSPRSPVILTGPKVERITVVTQQLWWLIAPLALFLVASGVLFSLRPGKQKFPLLITRAVIAAIGLSNPSIGSILNRPLSASAEPIYSASGDFVGIATEVRNRSLVSISQNWCRPDFEFRIIRGEGIWIANFESHDFHDVEFGECQDHKIARGSSRNVFSPFEGQEWVVDGGPVPPPGQYEALVRVLVSRLHQSRSALLMGSSTGSHRHGSTIISSKRTHIRIPSKIDDGPALDPTVGFLQPLS